MNELTCDFCKSVFKTKSALINHKNKAKYCLTIQGKIEKEKIEQIFKCNICDKILSSKRNMEIHFEKCKVKEDKIKQIFKCEYCNKILSSKQYLASHEKKCELIVEKKEIFQCEYCEKILCTKQTLLNHMNVCLIKKEENYKKQLEKQEDQIRELQDKLERLANKAIERPTTVVTTNNNLNITTCLDFNDIDKIRDIIENHLSINHVVDGQKGIAKFVKENLLIDDQGNLKYLCTDSSRSMFRYKDINGEIKKDIEAKKLTDYILNGGIRTKSADIGNEWCKDEDGDINMTKFDIMLEQQQSIMKLRDDNNTFKKELVAITTT
jgi:hypothetical protein